MFPPCMGGCIVTYPGKGACSTVSSLYGRVYRRARTAVSNLVTFPPCMGGCIVKGVFAKATFEVSSLHGRVYQENQIMTLTNVLFPPYMGGCIRISIAIQDNAYVSSLYGRVYRWLRGLFPHFVGFLPVREGVSVGSKYGCPYLTSPPCMGGCIGILFA